jgi:hypothetical protein
MAELICDLHADEARNDALGQAGARMVAGAYNLKQVRNDLRGAVKRTAVIASEAKQSRAALRTVR